MGWRQHEGAIPARGQGELPPQKSGALPSPGSSGCTLGAPLGAPPEAPLECLAVVGRNRLPAGPAAQRAGAGCGRLTFFRCQFAHLRVKVVGWQITPHRLPQRGGRPRPRCGPVPLHFVALTARAATRLQQAQEFLPACALQHSSPAQNLAEWQPQLVGESGGVASGAFGVRGLGVRCCRWHRTPGSFASLSIRARWCPTGAL